MPLPLNPRVEETSRLSVDDVIVEPLTLNDAKNFLKVPLLITADDDLITDMITTARQACEKAVSRTFVQASYRMTFDQWPAAGGLIAPIVYSLLATGTPLLGQFGWEDIAVVFPYAPLITVDAISFLDPGGTTRSLDPSPSANQVRIVNGTPGWMIPAFGKSFPILQPNIGGVSVDFTAGMISQASDVRKLPACIRTTMRYLCGLQYVNRSAGLDFPRETLINMLSPVIAGSTFF